MRFYSDCDILKIQLGSFMVTGLLDMIYDETGYGEEMFASFRQFALQENSVSLLEALEMVTDTEPGEIQRSLSAISITDNSTAKLELQSDSEGRIISVSTATNYDITTVDTRYDGTTYTDNEKANVSMQFNLSYEQFTITAPSDEQIIGR